LLVLFVLLVGILPAMAAGKSPGVVERGSEPLCVNCQPVDSVYRTVQNGKVWDGMEC